MKSMRAACKASAAKKLGNMRKAYKHGGKVYADGGMVDDEQDDAIAPAGKDLGIEGSKAKSRLDKGKTNINIIIAAGKDKGGEMPPVVPPMPPIPGKPPMPPMPPMGAGAGPMPPMKNGGRMAYKKGGRVHKADGGSVDIDDRPKSVEYRKGMPGTQSGMDVPDYGRIKAQQGRNLGLEMLNKPMRKHGGRIQHAAGGGLGRLEKIKAYGLKPAKGHG